MFKIKKGLFLAILLLVSLTASVFMVLEAGQFYQGLYSKANFAYMGFLAAGLNEAFMAIMAGVWLPGRSRAKGHPVNYLFRFLLVLLFCTTVGGASFNAIEHHLELIEKQANTQAILEVLRSQVTDHQASLRTFTEQHQPINSAITVRNQLQTKQQLVETLQKQKAVTGLWTEVIFLVALRIAVQLANLTCVWLAGWVWRRQDPAPHQNSPTVSPSLFSASIAEKHSLAPTPFDLLSLAPTPVVGLAPMVADPPLATSSAEGLSTPQTQHPELNLKNDNNTSAKSSSTELAVLGEPQEISPAINQPASTSQPRQKKETQQPITNSERCDSTAELSSPNKKAQNTEQKPLTGQQTIAPATQHPEPLHHTVQAKVIAAPSADQQPQTSKKPGPVTQPPVESLAEIPSELAEMSLNAAQLQLAPMQAKNVAPAIQPVTPVQKTVKSQTTKNILEPSKTPQPSKKVAKAIPFPPPAVKELEPIFEEADAEQTQYWEKLRKDIQRKVEARNQGVSLSAFCAAIQENPAEIKDICSLRTELSEQLNDRLEVIEDKINRLQQDEWAMGY